MSKLSRRRTIVLAALLGLSAVLLPGQVAGAAPRGTTGLSAECADIVDQAAAASTAGVTADETAGCIQPDTSTTTAASINATQCSVGYNGPARTPQPSLTRLDPLLAEVARAGLPITLFVRGRPANLPAGVDISAYRIVQEGLTNTLKHAGSVPTTITLDYQPDALIIEIRDPRSGHRPPAVSDRQRRARPARHARTRNPLRRYFGDRPDRRRCFRNQGAPPSRPRT